jgi:hypothetical protein
MLPRPDFVKLRALWKHMTQALKQLVCPQSQIHGWTGLVMDPGLYALIKPFPFTVPVNPGATLVYQTFAPPVMIKMVDYAFERNKNYFLSYSNINRACFCMLDDSVPIQFKVSNIPILTGLKASMSIQEILTQLETSYGKPTPMALHNNNLLFEAQWPPLRCPRCSFTGSSSARRSQLWPGIHTQRCRSSTRSYASSCRHKYCRQKSLTPGSKPHVKRTRG